MHKAVKQGLERLPGVYSAVMLTKLVKESFLQVLRCWFFGANQEVEKHTGIKTDSSRPTSLLP